MNAFLTTYFMPKSLHFVRTCMHVCLLCANAPLLPAVFLGSQIVHRQMQCLWAEYVRQGFVEAGV